MRIPSLIVLVLALGNQGTVPAAADDWPQWRGNGTGIAATDAAPAIWSESLNIRWKTPIQGAGHSSPIVSGDAVILTTAATGIGRDAESRYQSTVWTAAFVAAVGGFVLVRLVTPRRKRSPNAPSLTAQHASRSKRHRWIALCVSGACALTAIIIARHWAQPDLETLRYIVCIDRQTGTIRWQTECAAGPLLGSTALTSAATPTPTTDGRHIYAHFGVAGVYCLDFNGAVVWANHDPTPEILYKAGSSPVLWNDLLIVTHDTDKRNYTTALDKHTGAARWTSERTAPTEGRRERMDAYSTPIVVHVGDSDQLIHDGYRRITGYDPATGRELWTLPTDAEQIVTSPVADGDIVIFAGECNHPIHMTAIRLTSSNGATTATTIWQTKRQVPVVSSPAFNEGRVYAVSKSGIATCRETTAGDMIWRHRLPGTYYASITIAGGKLYLPNLDGVTTVMAIGDEPRVLATNTLDEPIYASPAVCDGELFIRGTGHLYCIAKTPSDSSEPDQSSR
ncbi:MAG: PQQ-binding-like beta-propeller repeat protein [Phycisphaerales bacterium]|nr:PQQ-binding-like beta-propeller repeat protein [Phycisphaerales bacterium]MCB9863843.1 PQQ-binding-like beta-propeller repeat protein [Phycisphaerales bacterium]